MEAGIIIYLGNPLSVGIWSVLIFQNILHSTYVHSPPTRAQVKVQNKTRELGLRIHMFQTHAPTLICREL